MKITSTLLTLALATATGCATVKKSMSLGMGIGMTGGAASGAMIAQRMKGRAAMEMGIITAILGGLSGYFIHQGMTKQREQVRRETLLNLESYGNQKRGGFYE